MLKNKISMNHFALLLCALIGIAIQIQATIGESKESFGLRVNVADLALPLMAGLVGVTLLFKKSLWPRWHNPGGILWPVSLTALMVFALWNGYHLTGEWSHWAIVNKFTGWFILMGYFGFGAWAAANLGNPGIRVFLQAFLFTFLLIAVVQSVLLVLGDTGLLGKPFQQLKGLMGNRNAMGLVILMAFTVLSVYTLAGRPLMPKWALSVFLAVLPLLLILCGSRATWLAFLIPVIGLIVIFRWRAVKFFRVTILSAILIIPALVMINGERGVFRESQNKHLVQLGTVMATPSTEPRAMSNGGDRQRIRVFKDSISFWKNHPVTGIGLGSFITLQNAKYQDSPALILGIIDSSPLWVLTETGLIGTALFIAFFGIALYTLGRTSGTIDQHGCLRIAMLFIVLSFGFMSLFHELLYTRVIWFMLGMALVVSRDELERIRANI